MTGVKITQSIYKSQKKFSMPCHRRYWTEYWKIQTARQTAIIPSDDEFMLNMRQPELCHLGQCLSDFKNLPNQIKFQAPKTKTQTNPNDPNSKLKTKLSFYSCAQWYYHRQTRVSGTMRYSCGECFGH